MADELFLIPLAVMLLSVGFGLFAPRPRFRVSDKVLADLTIGSLVVMGLGGMFWVLGDLDLAAMIMPFGMSGIFIGVWLATPRRRRRRRDDGWGGGGRGPDPAPEPGPGPVDWEAFQRDLAAWDHGRTRRPTPVAR